MVIEGNTVYYMISGANTRDFSHPGYFYYSMSRQPNDIPAGFIRHAREFLAAAELVLNQTEEVSLPSLFLFGHSIELSLKAFLLACGMTRNELKKNFGHNLEALLDESIKRGLEKEISIEDVERGVLQLLNKEYQSKRLEYLDSGGIYSMPVPHVIVQISRKLVNVLDEFYFYNSENGSP